MAGSPTYSREAASLAQGFGPIAGCDEAGTGGLAGPAVAAAVILDPQRIPNGLNDSKKLSAARREDLFSQIVETASVAVVQASVARIDRDNILQASLWALSASVRALALAPGKVLVDGRNAIVTSCPCETLIGGDGLSSSIAAASIVAKVTRDRLMLRLAEECPGYGFERHMGYGTADHLEALKRLGPSPHHRRTFAPVATLFGTFDEPLLPGFDVPAVSRSLEISA